MEDRVAAQVGVGVVAQGDAQIPARVVQGPFDERRGPVQVRDVPGRAGTRRDDGRFPDGAGEAVGPVTAQVADVDAARAGHRDAQGGQFGGVGELAGHVVQPGGQAGRAVGEGVLDDPDHAAQLVRGRRAGGQADHLGPHGRGRHEVGRVDRGPPVVGGQQFRDRDAVAVAGRRRPVDRPEVPVRVAGRECVTGREGDTVLAEDHRGDALVQVRGLDVRLGQRRVGV
jgi:hypothetical protein